MPDLILPPVRPNAGIEAAYRKRLTALVDAMQKSIVAEVERTYRANPPELAADASPAMDLRDTMRRVTALWTKRFNRAAPKLAEYFATAATDRADGTLKAILGKAGMTVKFKMTAAANDAYQAAIGENVALIKSIASQHLGEVEGLVMRSVQRGRDLGDLSKALEHRFKVTKRRAATISRDQNNKATAIIQRTRQLELGITEAIWMHSGGGKTPRPSHLKAGRDKVKFDLKTGWYDPDAGEFILPGELINCRCVSRPVLPNMKP